MQRSKIWLAHIAATTLGVAVLTGCGESGPPLHPVVGRVELKGGDVSQLAGSSVEVVLASDSRVRGFGAIQPDGKFRLESLQVGEVKPGVLQGEYSARIIPNTEDEATQTRVAKSIAKRYLKFETSGLKVSVPATGEVLVPIAAK